MRTLKSMGAILLVAVGQLYCLSVSASAVVDNRTESSRGEEIYRTVCSGCHETGVPKAPTQGMLTFMSTSAIYKALTEGVMVSRVQHLTDNEKQLVAEYLTGQPLAADVSHARSAFCPATDDWFDSAQPPMSQGWGEDYANTKLTTATTISAANVAQLKLKWAFGFPTAVRARSQPAVAGGAVFIGSQDGTVYALDRNNGCIRWQFSARAEVRTAIVISGWQSAEQFLGATLYFGDYLGNVYAVDAATGQQRWQVKPESHPNATITAAPQLYNGVLYVPVSSLEVLAAVDPSYVCCSFRGSVVALDAATGEQRWKRYTIDQPPTANGTNAVGVTKLAPSGAAVWNTPAIDTARSQLIFGTSESYSSPAAASSDAIIALDLTSGGVNWVFQATAGDAWNAACEVETSANCPIERGPDYDFGAAVMLPRDSAGRTTVIGGQKSGVVWALDPVDGALRWQRRVSDGGIVGGVHFGMAAVGERVIVPISDAQASLQHAAREPRPGVYALDLADGEPLWDWRADEDLCNGREYCMQGNGGAIVATAELVFSGSLDGYLRGYDIATGEVLWQFDTAREFSAVNGVPARGGAIEGGAAPVLSGNQLMVNSGYFFNPYMPGNVFLVFELEGQ